MYIKLNLLDLMNSIQCISEKKTKRIVISAERHEKKDGEKRELESSDCNFHHFLGGTKERNIMLTEIYTRVIKGWARLHS